jgi:dTDP-4-amino-4,6-dideoxygalactose transaminase
MLQVINVTKTVLPDLSVYSSYLNLIWETSCITNSGKLFRQLSSELGIFLNVDNINLVSNGTLALQLAIKALDLKGEIITTPFSYVATTNAILWEGCDPIFVDVDSRSFCINPDLIESSITSKTSAILATHVYGYPCNVSRVQEIASRYNLKVIYDAAHAFGVNLNHKSLMNYGDCSTLSFHATKLFHTAEGGAVICKNKQLSERVYLMSKFGHMGEEEYLDIGINAKMSELHAAMGLAILPMVDKIIAARRQCASWYDEFLADVPLQRPVVVEELEYNYAYYPVVFQSHEAMMATREVLQSQDIFPRRYFYPSLNTLPFLRDSLRRSCPVSESLAMRVLCLPMYPTLSREDIERISRCVTSSLAAKG